MHILPVETQSHPKMAHGETTKELAEEMATEEGFLKDLYLFMRKRDTAIERIPHLGFKQIDLFLMFTAVRDLGGYHQVTTQQLWKQVYNKLGGNPRSTSAATCTRRHYEKLLLPYECHTKGTLMNTLPQHQTTLLHDDNYRKDDEDGQRTAKRRLLSVPLHQGPSSLQSDPQGNVFPPPHHYSRYYHPRHAVLPLYSPMTSASLLTSHRPLSPEPRSSFSPSRLSPTDGATKSLENLRLLAEQYKTSSGLAEPLNLSVKAPSQESKANPASSFAPPSSSKNPKFLNKPSPLYSAHCSAALRNEGCETQDSDADAASYSYPATEGKAYIIDVDATGSPTRDSTPTLRLDGGGTAAAQKPCSPKTDATVRPEEDRKGSPEARGLSLSHILPNLPQCNGGKMEIQIPLSMLHYWLRLCGPAATVHGDKQPHALPPQGEQSRQRDTDTLPANLSLHTDAQRWRMVAEDLRLRGRSAPSPSLTVQTSANHHATSKPHFTEYKPLLSGSILQSASNRDVYPFDQPDVTQSYSPKAPNHWRAYDKESPLMAQRYLAATRSYVEDAQKEEKERSEAGSSAVLMHLTTEEVMKLKKIISNS